MTRDDTLDMVSKYSFYIDTLYSKKRHVSTDAFSRFRSSVHTACCELINKLMEASAFDDGELIVEHVMMTYYHLRINSSVPEVAILFYECEYVCKRILFWIKYENIDESKGNEFEIYQNERRFVLNEFQRMAQKK